jgi:hypothetical protein
MNPICTAATTVPKVAIQAIPATDGERKLSALTVYDFDVIFLTP